MIARMQAASLAGLFPHLVLTGILLGELPKEPVEIGFEPQFVFDNHIVDNHWAIKYKRQVVSRVFHPAKKHLENPILPGDNPSHLWVVRDPDSGLFRMYYQANYRTNAGRTANENQETPPAPKTKAKRRPFSTYIAYAESTDGLDWVKPDLDLFSWHTAEPNNIVIGGPGMNDSLYTEDGQAGVLPARCRPLYLRRFTELTTPPSTKPPMPAGIRKFDISGSAVPGKAGLGC